MSEIFNTPFCNSGRCIRCRIADKDRMIICISDTRNAQDQRHDRDVLVREYDRMVEQRNRMMTPDMTQSEVQR